jgi:hypothetical protein
MSKYYKWNKRGSRIIIDTGYKTFDKFIVCISKGQVIGGGQLSLYIRSYNETTCNGNNYQKGYLQDYDLKMFANLDYDVESYVKSITKDKGCMLYKFYTYKDLYHENVVGYIVEQNNKFEIFNTSYYSKQKKQKCLETIVKVLEEEI